ncbi:hypothetical protein AVEN_205238-1 [Araneus ventricosus]|uniref:Uncharacterized protein n=1 Tax=Araneus ventricosus TaxID=182803 RepID=A0A4Y2IGL0_ARAVE|nr:hypothetical protein AVEN_205238-1 [Araneus ventricosus]
MLPPSASCKDLFALFKKKFRFLKAINAAVYCPALRDCEDPFCLLEFPLIHDNIRPHNAVVTQQLLKLYKWYLSYHPANSPDLATSDFHLFPELKSWLGDKNFQKKEENQSNVKVHLTLLVETFFENGIENLVQ